MYIKSIKGRAIGHVSCHVTVLVKKAKMRQVGDGFKRKYQTKTFLFFFFHVWNDHPVLSKNCQEKGTCNFLVISYPDLSRRFGNVEM